MRDNKRLLIVSDTRIQLYKGEYYGFNSVVKELEVFQNIFSEITWIGYNYDDLSLDQTLQQINRNVNVITLPRSGGNGVIDKMKILILLPIYIYIITRQLPRADVVHSRGPSVPMLISLFISLVYKRPRWWFKYANNWNDNTPPPAWLLQKKLMINSTHTVGTINGQWPNTPSHIHSFENPCLDIMPSSCPKKMSPPYDLIFVGRITSKKGIYTLMSAINDLPNDLVNSITIIGDGPDLEDLKVKTKETDRHFKIHFTGNLPKQEVLNRMKDADFILLPTTASEGFPKVVAEAYSVGCIPVVSNISSINQYVEDEVDGFIWRIGGHESFSETLLRALTKTESEYSSIIENGRSRCSLFTYDYYEKKIQTKIL